MLISIYMYVEDVAGEVQALTVPVHIFSGSMKS
jgi:hypothetical protein